MLRASDLLKISPNLPPSSKNILNGLIGNLSDPELHIPGLPQLPPGITELAGVAKDAVVAFLGDIELEFYQISGVRFRVKGHSVGGIGAKVTEVLNVRNPTPNVKVAPVFELGAAKE